MTGKPHFLWKATLNDGAIINQFEGKVETLFSKVESNMASLKTFRIEAENGEFFEADIKNGTVSCNGQKTESLNEVTGKERLVYSRRTQARVNYETGVVIDSRITHRIGIENDDEILVVEAFPGLLMAEKNVVAKLTNKNTGETTDRDISENVSLTKL